MPRFSGIVSCAPCPLLLACLLLHPAVQNVRGHDQSSVARPLSEGGCIVMKAGSLDEPATVRAASDSTLASAPTLVRPRRCCPYATEKRSRSTGDPSDLKRKIACARRSTFLPPRWSYMYSRSVTTSFHKPRQIQVHFTCDSSSFSLPSSSSPRVPWPRPRKPRRRGRTKCCCKCSFLLAPRAPLHEPAFAMTQMDCRLARWQSRAHASRCWRTRHGADVSSPN